MFEDLGDLVWPSDNESSQPEVVQVPPPQPAQPQQAQQQPPPGYPQQQVPPPGYPQQHHVQLLHSC